MRRHLFMCILLGALLSGAWGQVLAAGLCPHMQQEHSCCHAQVAHNPDSHEMQSEMHIVPESEIARSAKGIVAGKLFQECDHCMGRSSQPSPTATLREVDATNQSFGLAAPAAASRISDPAPSFALPVPSREHGPPKASTVLHVLIGVFRI